MLKIYTGLVVEKKSISLPIVNGTLMETADETNSSPIAWNSGFRSGFAKATIFRNEEADCGDFLKAEVSVRDKTEGFGGVAGPGEDELCVE